jgi:hypothetical protein
MPVPPCLIENVLVPRVAKFSLMLAFKPSMAVRMPTSAMIPNAIIESVSIALTLFPLIEDIASLILMISSERKD